MKFFGLLMVLCTLLVSGCSTQMKPLQYQAREAYVPVSLAMGPADNRFDQSDQREMVEALRRTGAFSFLDGGFSKQGYSLLITQRGGKGGGLLVALNALTLLTFPMPYSYDHRLQGALFKDGKLIKLYQYSRTGWTVATWYVPPASVDNRRQMLDELLAELERDQLIPYQMADVE